MEELITLEEAVEHIFTNSDLNSNKSVALLGGLFRADARIAMVIVIVTVVRYILYKISLWRVFTKAGEKGWKALIPFYDFYIYLKIIGVSFWKWLGLILATEIVYSIAKGINVGKFATISGITVYAVSLIYDVLFCINTAKAFGRGNGFEIGLFFLPNTFLLILGFGSDKYQGVLNKEE